MNKKFLYLALAATVGLLVGGVGGSYFRQQNINWMFVFLNVVVVVGGLYFIFHKKEAEEEKMTWAERTERNKKKKRKKR